MIDFKKYGSTTSKVDPKNLKKLYFSKDLQSSHSELRKAQEEALEYLSNNIEQEEIFLKMSTGMGKTTIALVYLEAQRIINNRPVVYLCPTVQLVKQVLDEARSIGIEAVNYSKGEPHPDHKGVAAKAIIVCTYNKLFNAISTFDRRDVDIKPCAIVLDDVHSGIDIIRSSFTISIPKNELNELYNEIITIFDPNMSQYHPSHWQDILDEKPNEILEVPYWFLKNELEALEQILIKYKDTDHLKFTWNYLEGIIRWCRLVISGSSIEISPQVLPTHKVSKYQDSEHKLYISATMADDSVLVRELGCKKDITKHSFTPNSDKGIGERMILAPSLLDTNLKQEFVMKFCQSYANQINIVVLTSSEKKAKEWSHVKAQVFLTKTIDQGIKKLKESQGNFFVFVRRFDGLDLPDDSCRILVIDGLPYGERITDQCDSSKPDKPFNHVNWLAYRIEQALGRAVRSHKDYAVIILVGPDIGGYVLKPEIQEYMNPHTCHQLELIDELLDIMKQESSSSVDIFENFVKQCLQRDEGWKDFYQTKVRDKTTEGQVKQNDKYIKIAHAEREAFIFATERKNIEKSVEKLKEQLDQPDITEKEKGWLLQSQANYRIEYDYQAGMKLQESARVKNPSVFKTDNYTFIPKNISTITQQEEKILEYIHKADNKHSILLRLDSLRGKLKFSSSHQIVEDALEKLGWLLGVQESLRPERNTGSGPDNCWNWGSVIFIIEAKNKKNSNLSKKDSGQLHTSKEWAKNHYPSSSIKLVTVSDISKTEKGANYPSETKCITEANMEKLIQKLKEFYTELLSKDKEQEPLLESAYVSELLKSKKLDFERILEHYSEAVQETV